MSKQDLSDKLKSEVQIANWDMLMLHHKRGGLFMVEGEINLVEVGVALASDQVDLIKNWQVSGNFKAPNEKEISIWSKTPSKDLAEFLIIQPYVIIKLL